MHDDEVSAALQSGWKPRDEMAARTPNGDVTTFTPDQLTEYHRGRVPAPLGEVSQEELAGIATERNLEEVHGGAGATALAGVEGGFSALSFGGTDHLLTALGADTDKRAQANPYARAVGEVGTTVATTLLTGGLGGAAKGAIGGALAKATPLGMLTSRTGKLASTIGGTKGLMLAEGAEGLVSAAGGVVSKLAIKDEELTAKATLLDLGLGTVIGLGAGAAAGGLFKLAGKSAAAVPKRGLDFDAPETRALDQALGDATKVFKDADKHLGQRAAISRIGDLPDEYLADGYTARNIIQFIDDVAEGNADTATAVGKGGKELARARQARKTIDHLIEPQGENFGTSATKGRSKLYGPENDFKTTADIPALREAIQEYHEATVLLGKRVGLDDSEAKILKGMTGKGGLQRAFDEVNAVVPEADLAALKAARNAFESAGEYSMKSLARMNHGDLLTKLGKLDQYHTEMQKVASTLKVPGMVDSLEAFSARATQQLETMTGLSAGDIDSAYAQILRSVGYEAPAFKGPAADLYRVWTVNQAMRQGGELGEVLTKAAREAEDMAERKGAFEAGDTIKEPFGKRAIRSGVRRAAGYLGFLAGNAVGGPIVGAALAGSVSEAVSTGLRKGGLLSSATGKLLSAIATTAELAGKATRQVGINIGTVVRQTSFGGAEPPKKETARQSYERLSKEITAAATDPMTQTRINEGLAEIRETSWGVGDKMEVQAMTAVKYLADNLPKDPGVLQKWGISTWKPTDAQVLEFNNRVAAVVNPMNSIHRFMTGGGSPAEADAIKRVHPELFAEFQAAFMDNLPAMRDKVKGATRVRLGILFDAPIDSRLRPEFRTYMKEHWIARAEDQKPLDVNAGMTPEQSTPAQKLLG